MAFCGAVQRESRDDPNESVSWDYGTGRRTPAWLPRSCAYAATHADLARVLQGRRLRTRAKRSLTEKVPRSHRTHAKRTPREKAPQRASRLCDSQSLGVADKGRCH